eukprot:scaffold118735_cov29-Tisochrysis_lutea.AAC.5
MPDESAVLVDELAERLGLVNGHHPGKRGTSAHHACNRRWAGDREHGVGGNAIRAVRLCHGRVGDVVAVGRAARLGGVAALEQSALVAALADLEHEISIIVENRKKLAHLGGHGRHRVLEQLLARRTDNVSGFTDAPAASRGLCVLVVVSDACGDAVLWRRLLWGQTPTKPVSHVEACRVWRCCRLKQRVCVDEDADRVRVVSCECESAATGARSDDGLDGILH